MKKFLLIFTMMVAFVFGTNAQVMPAKFFDNTSIELKGGISTPLNDLFDGVSPQVGIQIEKGINPWLSFALDGDFYIKMPYWNNPHTAFDQVNVNALAKFNLFNLFGNYPGYRRHFEWDVYTGLGWSHRTCKDSPVFGHRNFGNYVAGTDFVWNLGKSRAWGIVLSPEVNWGMPEVGKLDKNKAYLEVNLGVVYHFKNRDGNRYFTKVRAYDQAEVDGLYARIYALMEENDELMHLNEALRERPVETVAVVETQTVEVTNTILPQVQFLFNSDVISETSYAAVNEIAKYINANEGNYVVTGYASNEGTEEYNVGLSQRRAQAMVDVLVEYGVDANRLSTKADGITEQFSESNASLNRVVTVTPAE